MLDFYKAVICKHFGFLIIFFQQLARNQLINRNKFILLGCWPSTGNAYQCDYDNLYMVSFISLFV